MPQRQAEQTSAIVKRDRKSGEPTIILTIENSVEDRLKTLNQMMRVHRALAEAATSQKLNP